jgi:hypothetical protein
LITLDASLFELFGKERPLIFEDLLTGKINSHKEDDISERLKAVCHLINVKGTEESQEVVDLVLGTYEELVDEIT